MLNRNFSILRVGELSTTDIVCAEIMSGQGRMIHEILHVKEHLQLEAMVNRYPGHHFIAGTEALVVNIVGLTQGRRQRYAHGGIHRGTETHNDVEMCPNFQMTKGSYIVVTLVSKGLQ